MLTTTVERPEAPELRCWPELEPCPLGTDKLELLGAMDVLRDLSEADVDSLMSKSPMRSARKGTVFYGADRGPEALFLLMSGRVELYRQPADGKRLTLAIVEPGSFFGEMSLIGHRLVGTYAMAMEGSVICVLSRQHVRSLVLEHPTVGLHMMEALAARLQQTRDSLEQMVFNDVTGRVAGLLLRLSDGAADPIEGYSHQDLAAMIGCLRESLTAALDGFKRSGALEIGRKRIHITDPAQLLAVVAQRAGG